jgi:hypothetical protein
MGVETRITVRQSRDEILVKTARDHPARLHFPSRRCTFFMSTTPPLRQTRKSPAKQRANHKSGARSLGDRVITVTDNKLRRKVKAEL